ncbi:MAG: UDP-N-acetylmuramoylalanyl-D-glutamyl-2,6-diaminopimelate--D-alanyl-D-alanyl ligase [Betaproteobacteria bacterium]|nr:UDP-N-acetylmuramoylalanyl-D-glutamyl-2,6-diaminopimelate--D-alanyl-D-alanyl ligase [Betaproteobacteria bacterium]
MMLLSDAARALQLAPPRRDAEFLRVNSDSRALNAGDLFVALVGERFDGHRFAPQALEQGAAGVLTARDLGLDAQIVAADSKLALGALAKHWRARFALPLIAVTGSNGKTTVTQMIASILTAHAGENAFFTQGNFNNDIGLPLTLLRLREHHSVGVVELGMNHPGEIAYLSDIARPTVALVNNAQREHQEFMKSVMEVAAENGSVFNSLPAEGVAVINADDEYAGFWRKAVAGREVIDFGLKSAADVTARVESAQFGSHMELMAPQGNVEVALRIPGMHNVLNACAAAACVLAAGVPLAAVAMGLNAFVPYTGRLQKKTAKSGAVVIDDTYNANPDSVRAAIDVLAGCGGERVLVLGRMGEVGDDGPRYHEEVGAYARERGIDILLGFGEETAPTVAGFGAGAERYAQIEALGEAALACSRPGVTFLIKGSRSTRMERVVAALTGETAGGGH